MNYYLHQEIETTLKFILNQENYKDLIYEWSIGICKNKEITEKLNSLNFNYEQILELINVFKSKQYSIEKKSAIEGRFRSENSEKYEFYKFVITASNLTGNLLEEYDFEKADRLQNSKDPFAQKEYESLKAKYIKNYFENNYKSKIENTPDLEQSEAIGALGKDVLVEARAGSGKTQTIAGKVAFLVDKYGVDLKGILVLCFNKAAADQMKARIEKVTGNEFKNARTFHSFALSIVMPEDLLYDKADRGDLTDFVSDIITKVENDDSNFRKKIYDFFRFFGEDHQEEKKELFSKEKYNYVKYKKNITLDGECVKSMGEKWIADFLFEHGIVYAYEPRVTWDKINKKYYHPDFSIYEINEKKQKNILLEHWGIDENEKDPSKQTVPSYWTKTWSRYKDEMNEKRRYCESSSYKLLETSISNIKYADKKNRRKKFEDFLKELIEHELGVKLKKLPIEELLEKAYKKRLKTNLNGYIVTFIGWMQKKEWSDSDLENAALQDELNSSQKQFIEIGKYFYKKYLEKLETEKKIDFNILISKATKKIKDNEYDVSIFKYILIDEFQDFSQLFQNLIDSIREKNSDVKLFCVGDDWQLINGYAGSDIKFFKDFKKKSSLEKNTKTNTKIISTCYRSLPGVIQYGNKFAKKHNKVFSETNSKEFKEGNAIVSPNIDIENVFIKNDGKNDDKVCSLEDNEYKTPFRIDDSNDKKYMPMANYTMARYLKKCTEIVKDNVDKEILILSRNKKFLQYENLNDFSEKLKEITKHPNVHIQTIHSSKGLEADVVILLNICEDVIPSIHPSNELFEIFGRTPNVVLDEERRLFYVAITRAKEKLYILTEKGRESEFIKSDLLS